MKKNIKIVIVVRTQTPLYKNIVYDTDSHDQSNSNVYMSSNSIVFDKDS